MDLFALFQSIVNGFFTQRTELLFESVVRDNVVLIFHRLDHCPEKWAARSDQKPCGLPEPLGKYCKVSLQRRRFAKTLHVDWALAHILSWVCSGRRCLNCVSHCSRNLRLSWWASISELLAVGSQPPDLLIQSVLLSLQCIFILCTSSSTIAISFCTDDHVNCKFLTSLHCEGSDGFHRPREHKTVHCTVSCLNTFPHHVPICHQFLQRKCQTLCFQNQVPPTILVHKPSSDDTWTRSWARTAVAVMSVIVRRNWSWQLWNLINTTVDSERTDHN